MAILKYLLSCHDLVLLVFNGCYDTHRFSKQRSIVLFIVALLTLPVFASTETDLGQQLFRLGLVMPQHDQQCAFFKELPTRPKYYQDVQIRARSMSLIDRAVKQSCFKGGVTVNWHDYQVLLDRACIQFVRGGGNVALFLVVGMFSWLVVILW